MSIFGPKLDVWRRPNMAGRSLWNKKNKAEFNAKIFPAPNMGTLIKLYIWQNAPMEFIINLLCWLWWSLEQQTPAIRQTKPSRALLIQFSTYHSSTNHRSIWKFPEQIVNSLSSVESISPILSLYNKCTNVPNQ